MNPSRGAHQSGGYMPGNASDKIIGKAIRKESMSLTHSAEWSNICTYYFDSIINEDNDISTGPAINSIVTDGDEPLPSLSDWHDYEPNLEFDDTELTHPPPSNGMYCNHANNTLSRTHARARLKCVDKIASSFDSMIHALFDPKSVLTR